MTALPSRDAPVGGSPLAVRLRGLAGGLAGGSALLFGLKIGGAALGLLMHVALARLLGVEAYGVFATAFNAATLVALVAAAGLPMTASRFLPHYLAQGERAKARGYIDAAWLVTLAGGAAGAVCLALAAAAAPGALRIALVAAAPLVLAQAAAQTAAALLQALRRPLAAEAESLVLRPVLIVAAAFMGARTVGLDAAGATAIVAAGAAAALWPTLRAFGRAVSALRLPAQGSAAWRLWLTSGATLLVLVGGAALNERLDVMILSALADPAAAGVYSVAARVAALISLGTAAASVRATPAMADALARGDRGEAARMAAQASRTACGLALAAGVPLACLAPPLLAAFGAGFSEGATALRALVLAHMALALGAAASALLIAAGREKRIVVVTVAGVALNVALNVALVPPFGATGAAAATLATMALTSAGLILAARVGLGVDILRGRDLQP